MFWIMKHSCNSWTVKNKQVFLIFVFWTIQIATQQDPAAYVYSRHCKMIQIVLPTILVILVLLIITLQVIYPRVWMEISFMVDKIHTSRKIKKYSKQAIPTTAVDLLEAHARKTPDKPFLVYRDVSHTYNEVNKRANRLAHLARQCGLKKGDTVAILVQNEPAFVETLFGMAKLGVTSALLNFNLRSKSLLHCFDVSQAKTLIVGPGKIADCIYLYYYWWRFRFGLKSVKFPDKHVFLIDFLFLGNIKLLITLSCIPTDEQFV